MIIIYYTVPKKVIIIMDYKSFKHLNWALIINYNFDNFDNCFCKTIDYFLILLSAGIVVFWVDNRFWSTMILTVICLASADFFCKL